MQSKVFKKNWQALRATLTAEDFEAFQKGGRNRAYAQAYAKKNNMKPGVVWAAFTNGKKWDRPNTGRN